MPGPPEKQRKRELREAVAPRTPKRFLTFGRGPVYRVAQACFACRRSFKIAYDPMTTEPSVAQCADCGGPLKLMGRSFKVPKRSDVEQWKKIEALWDAGFRFWGYRSHPDAEPLPGRLDEVADFVRRNPVHPARTGSLEK